MASIFEKNGGMNRKNGHNFAPNQPRNLFWGSIPMFFDVRNRLKQFPNTYNR